MSFRRGRILRAVSLVVVVGMSTSLVSILDSQTAGAANTTVNVTGDASFTHTNVFVNAGQTVRITADSTPRIDIGNPSVANGGIEPPDGGGNCGLSGFVLPGASCWSLIGRFGSGPLLAIGSSKTLTATDTGELLLGINDNAFPDNTGNWIAHITTLDLTITPGVDPPAVRSTTPTAVTYATPTASDDDGSVPVVCDRPSGSVFPLGVTTVTCAADKAGDNPAHAETTLTVRVFAISTRPGVPRNVAATGGDGTGIVTFDPPVSDGFDTITKYDVSCTSSNGGKSGSASGPHDPITVPKLDVGRTYTCTVTATNSVGTGLPSAPSNTFSPFLDVVCTNQTTCRAQVSAPASPTAPLQNSGVVGVPSDLVGTVTLSVAPGLMSCPSVTPAPAPITTLDNSGFASSTTLTVTMTLFLTAATDQEQVCFDSTRPFRSQSSPGTPAPGPGLLLSCADVGNVAPCLLSSAVSGNNIVVKFLVPGGDPRFYLVLPKGRQVWLSKFPPGKVGARYTAQLQSSGGKAPIKWKVLSGKLPAGLTLNPSTGAITGIPKAKGNFSIVARATDSESPPKVAQMTVPITIK